MKKTSTNQTNYSFQARNFPNSETFVCFTKERMAMNIEQVEKNALLFARFSNLAYETEEIFKTEVVTLQQENFLNDNWSEVELFSLGSTQIYVCFSAGYKRGVVAARGTEKKKEDIWKDLDVTLTETTDDIRPYSSEGIKWKDTRVHDGFYKGLFTIEPSGTSIAVRIYQKLLEHKDTLENLYFTGHSLGGALVNIFSLYFLKANENNHFSQLKSIDVFTYGQPCVGTDKYSKAYDRLLKLSIKLNYYRFVNDRDIVTRYPHALKIGFGLLVNFPYVQSPKYHYLIALDEVSGQPSISTSDEINNEITGSSDDHKILNYIAIFEKLVPSTPQ